MAAPYVLLSCAMSVDGYIDYTSSKRLLLSNADDVERVDAFRPSDAILIGAYTLRRDNLRLLVNSEQSHAVRIARGFPDRPPQGHRHRIRRPRPPPDVLAPLWRQDRLLPRQRRHHGHRQVRHPCRRPVRRRHPCAPRFVRPGSFVNELHHRMTLAEVRAADDVALLRYLPGA